MTLAELRKRRAEIRDEMKAITDLAQSEKREITDEEEQKINALLAEDDELSAQIEETEAAQKRKAERVALVQSRHKALDDLQPRRGFEIPHVPQQQNTPQIEVPDTFNVNMFRHHRVKNFDGATETEKALKAYRFGRWAQAALCFAFGGRNPALWQHPSIQWCEEHGLSLTQPNWMATSHEEGNNWLGGFLVPPEFDSDMIDLRERYGVFRANARIRPMMSDTKQINRRVTGLTAYFVGEGGAGTVSNKTWDAVNLVAKKLMVLSTSTVELTEDATISIGDDLAGEVAYAFANKEDECGFNGDGTSTYGTITGVISAMGSASKETLTSGSDSAWSSITLADMHEIVATLPEYADTPNAKWYCSKQFFNEVMEKLMTAAGGNTQTDIAGGRGKFFLGYPVVTSQVLPTAQGTAEVVVLLGDLRLAASLGDRRGTTIAFSTDAYVGSTSMFETEQIAIRGTERFDIVAHDVGDASNAGPLVGGLTAS